MELLVRDGYNGGARRATQDILVVVTIPLDHTMSTLPVLSLRAPDADGADFFSLARCKLLQLATTRGTRQNRDFHTR